MGAWATHAALLVVQIAFASQAVEAKIAMLPREQGGEGIFPEALAMARMLGGALFFQALALVRSPQTLPIAAVTRSDHARLLGLSILGIALNQTLFLLGLRWTTPFSVSLLGATIPVFTAALAILFRKETFKWRTIVGLSFAIVGAASLSFGASAGSSSPRTMGFALDRGVVLVTLNSLSYAAYVVLSRDVVRRVGAIRLTTWIFTYGALLFAPVGLGALVTQLPELTPRGWLFVAYILVMPTIVAYSLNAWALGRSSPTLVTIYIYLQPLIAAVLAWVQLGHRIEPRAALAAAFILVGLGIVTRRTPPPVVR